LSFLQSPSSQGRNIRSSDSTNPTDLALGTNNISRQDIKPGSGPVTQGDPIWSEHKPGCCLVPEMIGEAH